MNDLPAILYTAIGALSAAIVFLFKLNISANERSRKEAIDAGTKQSALMAESAAAQLALERSSADARLTLVLDHHSQLVERSTQERQTHASDRERYIAKLEELTSKLSAQNLTQGIELSRVLQENSEAIKMNTTAREQQQAKVEDLMEHVVGTVLLKLVEMKILTTPGMNPAPSNTTEQT